MLLTSLPEGGKPVYHFLSTRRKTMRTSTQRTFEPAALGIGLLICAMASAGAEDKKNPYPAMAPLAQYMMATPAEEIALARTAAPPSIAGDAGVMVLGNHG